LLTLWKGTFSGMTTTPRTTPPSRAFEVTARPANPRLPFVRAVKTGPNVRTVYFAGTLGIESETADVAATRPADMREEATRVFSRLEEVLATAGATLRDVVQVTKFLTDIRQHVVVAEVMREFFGDDLPTSVTVEVNHLVPEGYGLEVSGIAVVGGSDDG
jgi:enamine deaminase RidA (YjgF/YER057c/UK114 family)